MRERVSNGNGGLCILTYIAGPRYTCTHIVRPDAHLRALRAGCGTTGGRVNDMHHALFKEWIPVPRAPFGVARQ
jgi:hypothetical protein